MTLARADSAVGEVALRSRGEVVELVVGGVFVMDTVDTSTEIELATTALARHAAPRRVLVGGLGLGFTAAAVLTDGRVEEVVVAEIAAPLVGWAARGLLPADGLRDPRLDVRPVDVAEVLRRTPGEWDLVLLDVDNGPGFLVRPENAGLYGATGLRAAVAALAPGGLLAIWSSHRAPDLYASLAAVCPGPVSEVVRRVLREGRDLEYAIYLAAAQPGARTDLSTSPTGG